MEGRALLRVKDPDHRARNAWEISSELTIHASKSCLLSPTSPQLGGCSPHGKALWVPTRLTR